MKGVLTFLNYLIKIVYNDLQEGKLCFHLLEPSTNNGNETNVTDTIITVITITVNKEIEFIYHDSKKLEWKDWPFND